MPMIDIYAAKGTFDNKKELAQKAAQLIMQVEQVPPISMFKNNTAGFVHELDDQSFSNASGDSNYVRVQVLTNQGALDRDKQLELTEKLTQLISEAAHDESLKDRTWVLITEAVPGGWGLWGHAHTNEELVEAAKKELSGK
ncbi:tautomerase family protein [Pediococcus argentinicus]|uniref:4-oxalocrotonate tautomerase domain-containing protein n=1 Tax=Pediococcus argentinicus TaxID=480391 RepID=A0A0R2NER0_9LACO|nr:hypothetical protein [Pediococcus argentinicus]KRO23067.1 hypothetical protein IV88_GL001043 [Pediococcus argentinicus]NKZ22949.1 hypothetical protein [Pediococcus argentinicus]GEP20020.1 hypothetical protein LSA03_14040 [Pediococcus argentinicus]